MRANFRRLRIWSTGGLLEPAIFPEILRPPLRWASQLVWPLPAAEAMPPSAESPPPIIPALRLSGVFRVASVSRRDCRTAANAGIDPIRHKDRFLAGCGIGLVRSGSVRHRVSRCCGVQDCIHGAAPQDLAVQRHIIARHALHREALLKAAADRTAIERFR
jgi:hypothetical protein